MLWDETTKLNKPGVSVDWKIPRICYHHFSSPLFSAKTWITAMKGPPMSLRRCKRGRGSRSIFWDLMYQSWELFIELKKFLPLLRSEANFSIKRGLPFCVKDCFRSFFCIQTHACQNWPPLYLYNCFIKLLWNWIRNPARIWKIGENTEKLDMNISNHSTWWRNDAIRWTYQLNKRGFGGLDDNVSLA